MKQQSLYEDYQQKELPKHYPPTDKQVVFLRSLQRKAGMRPDDYLEIFTRPRDAVSRQIRDLLNVLR